jgi:hypothetical protein
MPYEAGTAGVTAALLQPPNGKTFLAGVVAEWLNAAVLKTAERVTVP